jgi:hypothetical protein
MGMEYEKGMVARAGIGVKVSGRQAAMAHG